jgi:hypothetical protein
MVMRNFGPNPQRVGLLYVNYLIITQRFDGFPNIRIALTQPLRPTFVITGGIDAGR